MVQTAWILHRADSTDDSGSAGESTVRPASPRREFSRSTSAAEVSGRPGIEEKARSLAGRDPQAAWQQSLAITNFAERSAFLAGLMREWARIDPAAALEMAGTLPAGALRQQAFDAACAGWVSQDPEAAALWATHHLTGPLAGQAFGSIAKEWAASDPKAAADWPSPPPPRSSAPG
jgi:hypothetical protein